MKVSTESQELVRAYLSQWSEEDWDEVDRLRSAMSIPDALVQVHHRKLAEYPIELTVDAPTIETHFEQLLFEP